MTEHALVPPSWRALYAPWEPASRRSYGWAAPFVVAVTYFVSAIPMAILVVVAIAGAPGGLDAASARAGALPPGNVLLPGILMQFALWGALVIVWMKAFERRGFASMGLSARSWLGRYVRGLAIGVALVLALAIITGAVITLAPAAVPEAMRDLSPPAGADWSALLGPAFTGFALFVLVTFLIQGGAEEVIFRGWLMSTLTARWGAVAAIIASSIIFGAFHIHVLSSGMVFGACALAGVTATGIFFALYAYAERSVWGAMGGHGAFNAAVTLMPFAAGHASDPQRAPADLFAEIFTRAAGLGGEDTMAVGAHLLVQPVVFLVLSGLLLLAMRAKKES